MRYRMIAAALAASPVAAAALDGFDFQEAWAAYCRAPCVARE